MNMAWIYIEMMIQTSKFNSFYQNLIENVIKI